jgi:3-phosphoshikimate 1-carboxyvinyltransferase
MKYRLSYQSPSEQRVISLNGSKSISNRALIIRALARENFKIENISTAKDTETLLHLLNAVSAGATLDTGAAGTTFRFLTAYLSLQDGKQILTGSERMKQRPIGELVEALRKLGASIEYLEEEGYPPLKIGTFVPIDITEISLAANISSQFISALMLIAPVLPNGLIIHLEGEIVSLPYLLMTKNLMSNFGAKIDFDGKSFSIQAGPYQAKSFSIEGDWSAASYFYSIVAFEKVGYQISLQGLRKDSVQGDQVIAEIGKSFGVDTSYHTEGITIKKVKESIPKSFDYNFILCPDLAQSVSIMMAGLGVQGKLSGLRTLRIKETDRILALQQELEKAKVNIDDLGQEGSMIQNGHLVLDNMPIFETYEDHRMAMTLTCLAVFGAIEIKDPNVVEKSYPNFWKDIAEIGFEIKSIS